MTLNDYRKHQFFTGISLILQFILIVFGIVFMVTTWGWFIGGVTTAIFIISTIIMVLGDIEQEAIAAYYFSQDDPDEDK